MSGSTRWILALLSLAIASLLVSVVTRTGDDTGRHSTHAEQTFPDPEQPAITVLPEVHRALGTLQYVVGDYPLAVDSKGNVLDAEEYEEQHELLEDIGAFLANTPPQALPDTALSEMLAGVQRLVKERAAPQRVRTQALALRDAMIQAYAVRMAPVELPSLARGQALYAQSCVACHGNDGTGQTVAAQALDPKPTNLRDVRTAATLSPYQVFNVVSFGVEGTAMPAFPTLTESERWDLAFFTLTLRHDDGAAAMQADDARFAAGLPATAQPPLDFLSRSTDEELAAWLASQGVDAADVAVAVSRVRLGAQAHGRASASAASSTP